MASTSFDIIIIGAGLSGLSLLARLVENKAFDDKKILLLDRAFKNRNDKTWCFWEKEAGYFEDLVHHQWSHLEVIKGDNADDIIDLDTGPYRYKMIRSIDFYQHCISIGKSAPNVTIVYDEVTSVDAINGIISCGDNQYISKYIFSSVLMQQPLLKEKEFYLLQHFLGWTIETETDRFTPDSAELMNFNVSQQHGCTFVYVLPVSSKKALIEYTLFSEEELPEKEYEQGLQQFIATQLGIRQYKITEVEKGVIPMTNLHFPKQEGQVFYIGTAGGQTKASTGYTFKFIQKQSAAIVQKLVAKKAPLMPPVPKRFQFYDSVLLRVLHERKMPGADVFYQMFRRNKASQVFRFLDNETNLWEELQIMNSSHKKVFIPAALRELQ